MAYPTIDDMTFAAGSSVRLAQLTDRDGTAGGAVNATVMNMAISASDGEVNSYLKKVFEVPLATPPDEIRAVSARIAVYKMKCGSGMAGAEEIRQHEADMKWLESIAKGDVVLGVTLTPAASSMRVDRVTARPTTKAIGRAKLRGFH